VAGTGGVDRPDDGAAPGHGRGPVPYRILRPGRQADRIGEHAAEHRNFPNRIVDARLTGHHVLFERERVDDGRAEAHTSHALVKFDYNGDWPAAESGFRRAIELNPGDLPRPLRFSKHWPGGVYIYYYIWQFLAYLQARQLHRQIGFGLVHHVTFCMYWLPSFMAMLDVPFVWGPVGGGESAPKTFRRTFTVRGRIYETLRDLAQVLGTIDPAVRMTARRSTLARSSGKPWIKLSLACRRCVAARASAALCLGFVTTAAPPSRACPPVTRSARRLSSSPNPSPESAETATAADAYEAENE